MSNSLLDSDKDSGKKWPLLPLQMQKDLAKAPGVVLILHLFCKVEDENVRNLQGTSLFWLVCCAYLHYLGVGNKPPKSSRILKDSF